MSQQHIVIIDGLSFLFRAYHGVRRGLTRSDGTPTNALFGFAQMLVKVVDDLKPDVCLVALDSVGPTFRKTMYPAYKANRPPPDEEMLVQLRMFQPMVEAFGIPAIRVEGVEADDIIATVVKHYCVEAANGGCKVTIVSSDKDLMQLISPNVRMLDTMKDKWFGVEEVVEKFGVGPEKVIDVQALIGDNSDNIPGARGIGPKGAADLLQKFASVDDLYENISHVEKEALRDKLVASRELVMISRQLVTLKTDVMLPVGWNELTFAPRVEVAADYLEDELEFRTLAARLRKRGNGNDVSQVYVPPTGKDPFVMHVAVAQPKQPVNDWYAGYECVTDAARWEWWLDEARKVGRVAFDTETTSLEPYDADVVGISLCVGVGKACYVPFGHKVADGDGDLFGAGLVEGQLPREKILSGVRMLLADSNVTIIAHNLKYDWLVTAKALEVIPVDCGPGLHGLMVGFEDTMLLSACLDGGRHGHGLDFLADKHLGHTMVKYEEVAGKGKAAVTFDRVELDIATRYAAEDADATWRLWETLQSRLVDEGGRSS